MTRSIEEEEASVFRRLEALAEVWEGTAKACDGRTESLIAAAQGETLRQCAHALRGAIHGAQLRLAQLPCSLDRAMLLMPRAQVVEALKDLRARKEVFDLLHALGLSDRDLKPENVSESG
jgi:hypothetical protein